MTNMGLIGQFVEIPEQMTTIDYFARGSQMAVHRCADKMFGFLKGW